VVLASALAFTIPYVVSIGIELTRDLKVFLGEGYFGYHYIHSGPFGGGGAIDVGFFQGAGWLPMYVKIHHGQVHSENLLVPVWFLLPLPFPIWIWAWMRWRLASQTICGKCGYAIESQPRCPECGRLA
jgi:hypothetical protein